MKKKGSGQVKISDVYSKLCTKDRRSPHWNDIYGADDDDISEPRKNCACDNCYYGRDELALEIIRLSRISDAAIAQGCTCPMLQDDPRIRSHTSNCLKIILEKLKENK